MSEENNLEEFELSDDAIESAAGGIGFNATPGYNNASFTCRCGEDIVIQRESGQSVVFFLHTCGERYTINFLKGSVVDSRKWWATNLKMY